MRKWGIVEKICYQCLVGQFNDLTDFQDSFNSFNRLARVKNTTLFLSPMNTWQPNPKVILQKFPNQDIFLYKGFAELIGDEQVIEGKAIVTISWYPFPVIKFKFTYHGEDRFDNTEGDIELKLTELASQNRLRIHVSSHTHWGSGKSQISGYLSEPFIQGSKVGLSSLVFHIPNFWRFNISNSYDEDEDGNVKELDRWLMFDGQFTFECDKWRFFLSTLENCFDIQELLESQGGYGITHICKMERLDHSQFNLDEAYDQIKAFSYYLSFCRGFWVAPVLLTGFDSNGNQILEEWNHPVLRCSSYNSNYTWAHSDSTEITTIFPQFMKKWNDKIWQGVIQNSIQWYIESLQGENNTSIVLIQAALEKLAWTFLKSNNCLSSDGFKSMKASDQIRLLLKFLNVPIKSLDNYTETYKRAKEFNWNDSLVALTEVRNLIVHPQVKKSNNSNVLSEAIMDEVFLLSHSYLEHCLLKLFEYPYLLDD